MRHADAGYDEALDARARRARPAVSSCRAACLVRCLDRDLAQVVTPAGRDAPVRGPRRFVRSRRRSSPGYVLCEDGLITAVGRMSRRSAARGRGRGARRPRPVRGSGPRPLRYACGVRGDRVEEFSPAGGRREVRGAACCPAAASSRRSGLRGRQGRGRPASSGRVAPRPGCAAHGDDDLRGEIGLWARPRHRARVAPRDPGDGRPSDVARRARRPAEFDDADAYLDFVLAEVLPDAARLAEAADVFLERGSLMRPQARRYLEACRAAGLALRLHGDQFTESELSARDRARCSRSVDHLEATGPAGIAALASSAVVGVLLPASALFPLEPADASRTCTCRRRRRRGARNRLQPRVVVLRQPPPDPLARLHAAPGSPPKRRSRRPRSTPRTCSAGRAGLRESRPGSRPTSCCSTPPTGAISPTTSAGPVIAAVIQAGRVEWEQ